MNPYSSYKDSGVEWIGEIPSDWINTKIKYVGDYINGFPFKPSQWGEKGRLIIRIQNLTKGNSTENYFDGELEDRYIIKKGDLLFSWSTTLGLFEWDREDGLLNQHIFKVVLNNIYIKGYFIHLFSPVVNYLQSQSHGSTMTHLTKDNFGRVELPLPPLPEQTQIVSFLDTKTQKIDELIQKTEQKIKLLKEKRTSLINHCVTKGLNPNVEMKDSGVEWIGEIPSHWETVKLKYTIKKKPNNGIFKKREEFGDGVPLVNVGDLFNKNNFINKNKLDKVRVDESELEKFEVQNFDVFFVRSSLKLEGIGVSSMIDKIQEPTVFECHIIRVIPEQGTINPYYFNFFLNSYLPRNRLISISQTVTMTTISQEHITSLEILSPPLTEQTQIVEYLDEQTQKIDSTIKKETQRIELLKEYRQSLISEVVTGKVDVRDWNG